MYWWEHDHWLKFHVVYLLRSCCEMGGVPPTSPVMIPVQLLPRVALEVFISLRKPVHMCTVPAR